MVVCENLMKIYRAYDRCGNNKIIIKHQNDRNRKLSTKRITATLPYESTGVALIRAFYRLWSFSYPYILTEIRCFMDL